VSAKRKILTSTNDDRLFEFSTLFAMGGIAGETFKLLLDPEGEPCNDFGESFVPAIGSL